MLRRLGMHWSASGKTCCSTASDVIYSVSTQTAHWQQGGPLLSVDGGAAQSRRTGPRTPMSILQSQCVLNGMESGVRSDFTGSEGVAAE